ncbi:hypothetical protein Leryth_012524 [Lithospermum erythrorhizon]|nr:hypothetical protein Leryth_012524 [Lithospermum erythrorhizon]
MATFTFDPTLLGTQDSQEHKQQRDVNVVEEIEGLIKVFEDGQVERPQIVPNVTPALPQNLGVKSRDVSIDKFSNIWARFYVPTCPNGKLPLLIYFHGGGFCVGSASWSCYHEFLARLSAKANCVIMSINYRLAPENPLPAAFDDGLKTLAWLQHQFLNGENEWITSKCNFSSIYLGGDSAGANIAHNVALKLGSNKSTTCDNYFNLLPLRLNGTILIQPFFGGEVRTNSEKYMAQSPRSALTLAASDCYWRLALPEGANRDHPWCNPMAKGGIKLEDFRLMDSMVCVAEMDILKDRNLEFCNALARGGNNVEHVMCKGVGHAFQILSKSPVAQKRTVELIYHIKKFITR